jgi:replicative superfamily II helicase
MVGVDVQLDEEIEQLPFAGADAEWIHALLADLNERDPHGCEGDLVLLLGVHATRVAVTAALQDLATRSGEADPDLVMIHFSCHGTPEGHLLMSDAVAGQESTTGLAFDEVARALEAVSAEYVVVSFDTCFSGRAISGEAGTRTEAVESRMERLATGNRAIITAARADERARESPRHGHGLLSYGLIEGLDGRTLAEAGTVSIARWLSHAAAVVEREAAAMGAVQHVVQFSRWEGAGTMPAAGPGPRTRALLARGDLHIIGSAIADLAVYGFSEGYITAISTRTNGNPLNPMQVAAINQGGVLAGRNVVVSAPTSSGKTLVGELAALRATLGRRRAVVLLPTRALVAEKWTEFKSAFGPLGLRGVRSYGGIDDDDQALATHHFDVAFLTYEKFLLLALTRPRILDVLATVVLDEVHLLADRERGRRVEILLTLLRWRARQGRPVQIVALSAAIGEMNGFERWLDAIPIFESGRPVPLREGVISPSGRFRYRDPETGEEGEESIFAPIASRRPNEYEGTVAGRVAVALAERLTADESERVLMFRAHKPQTRTLASMLGEALTLERCDAPLAVMEADTTGQDTSRATRELAACLTNGVAFHLTDLEQPEREAIEGAFRRGELRCLVATSTLAMGINSPATTVVVVDQSRYDGPNGNRPFPVTEYRNMAGRAGRWIPGGRPGKSFLVAADDRAADELFEQYVLGKPEPLVSRLGELDRADLLLSLLAFVPEATESVLVDLAADTFDGFTNAESSTWRRRFRDETRKALTSLVSGGFVARAADGGIEATALGRICGREGISVASARRVLRSVKILFEAGDPLDETSLIALTQLTTELDETFIPFDGNDAEGWPALVPRRITGRDPLLGALGAEPALAGRRLKRFYTMVRWVQGVPMTQIEQEFSGFREPRRSGEPVAGSIRGIASRTGHMLRPVGALIATAYPDRHDEIRSRVVGLQPRLEFGIGRDAAGLARYRLGITRGQINRLRELNRATFDSLYEALRARDPEVLAVFGSTQAAALQQSMDLVRVRAARQSEADLAAQIRLFDDIPVVSSV